MRTLLATGYDEKMSVLGKQTSELMQKYARYWGFDFESFNFQNVPNYHPSWIKIIEVGSRLSRYDRVIWMDADVIITNPKIPIIETNTGFHASRDWGIDSQEWDFNAGAYIAHKDTLVMFELALFYDEYQNKPLWDQSALRAVVPIFKDKITIYPRRTFNAVPIDIHETVVDPWQPGDWLCHLTMVPLEKKIELFHKYAPK